MTPLQEYTALKQRHDSSGYCNFLSWRRVRAHNIDRLAAKNRLNKRAAFVRGKSEHWPAILDMPHLEELHLHCPTAEQWQAVSNLTTLKRLSIDSYRPEDISILSPLVNLEELNLKAISGFTSLEPISDLKNLKAFSSYMLRGVKDFHGLSGAKNIRYLNITSSFDFKQPIENLDFLYGLENIKYILLDSVRILQKTQAALPLTQCKKLKNFITPRNSFYLDDFALIEMGCQDAHGTHFSPVELEVNFSHGNTYWVETYPWGTRLDDIHHIDMHRPLAPALEMGEALLAADLFQPTDMGYKSKKSGWVSLLGRGSRKFKSDIKNANKRAQAHIEKYNDAKERAKELLQTQN